MNSMEGEQITSTVVRSWRAKNDSVTPRSSVERAKCESTICHTLVMSGSGSVHRNLPGHALG